MLTVCFPVFDTTIENGCLCVVPESHTRGLLLHCPSKPGQVFDLRIPEVVRGSNGIAVEMKRGSALFMHRLTVRASVRDRRKGARWTCDVRDQPGGEPTGRDCLPAFVPRGQKGPSREVRVW